MTQEFVLGQGFEEVAGSVVLAAQDGSRRLLAEIGADPDRPETRAQEAYRELLASLAPGWTLRLLQVNWPDPGPRRAFLTRAAAWPGDSPAELDEDGALKTLRQGLQLFLEGYPLPYRRRTLLEFVLPPGPEGLNWWAGVGGTLRRYGLSFDPLDQEGILALARHLLNPALE